MEGGWVGDVAVAEGGAGEEDAQDCHVGSLGASVLVDTLGTRPVDDGEAQDCHDGSFAD